MYDSLSAAIDISSVAATLTSFIIHSPCAPTLLQIVRYNIKRPNQVNNWMFTRDELEDKYKKTSDAVGCQIIIIMVGHCVATSQ